MVIKVIGMGCENCDKLYENVMDVSYRITCNNGNQRTLINP